MAAAAVSATVASFRGAEEVALAAATATSVWSISVPRLPRLDDAPRVLTLLEPLRYPAPPRLVAWDVNPLKKLRAAARISDVLASATARIAVLLGDLHHRPHFLALEQLGIDVRSVARRLPLPARALYINVGNRIRNVARRGIKSGGFPAGRTRHHLVGLSARVAHLQADDLELA